MTPKQQRALKQRFVQSYGSLDSAALASRARAIVGAENLPNTPQGQLARSALEKLKAADSDGPTPNEWAALEYMIRLMRPSKLVHKGKVDDDTDPAFQSAFSNWEKFRAAVPSLAFSIGRVSQVTSTGEVPEGTAFIVAPKLIMTNAHVLDALSNGARVLERGRANVQFVAEDGDFSGTPAVEIVNVRAVHPILDACLLEIDDTSEHVALEFSTLTVDETTQVGAIGFPYPDDRDPLFVTPIFQNRFGVKRAAPGFITGTQAVTNQIFHDCTTLGGCSGAPIISMSDGKVLGLHTGGGFLWRNEAVCASPLAAWIAQPGVRNA
jgi:hypothetical protein